MARTAHDSLPAFVDRHPFNSDHPLRLADAAQAMPTVNDAIAHEIGSCAAVVALCIGHPCGHSPAALTTGSRMKAAIAKTEEHRLNKFVWANVGQPENRDLPATETKNPAQFTR